jgi:thioredoxin-like negative regulator of GroEL
MPSLPSALSPALPFTLDSDNYGQLLINLQSQRWVVACLCAAWCNTCGDFQAPFMQLATRFPEVQFVWIDIEDQANVVGDLDVENFPTLLIQQNELVNFFGTVLPDAKLTERLLQSLMTQSPEALTAQTTSSSERRQWQQDCNLRRLLEQA